MALLKLQFYHKADSTSALDAIKHENAWFYDTTKGHAIAYLPDGVTIKHFIQGDVNNNIVNPLGNIPIVSGSYLGLGAAKGRLVFSDDAIDTISIKDANLALGANYLSYGGTNAGISLDAANNVTLSRALIVNNMCTLTSIQTSAFGSGFGNVTGEQVATHDFPLDEQGGAYLVTCYWTANLTANPLTPTIWAEATFIATGTHISAGQIPGVSSALTYHHSQGVPSKITVVGAATNKITVTVTMLGHVSSPWDGGYAGSVTRFSARNTL